MHLCYIDESGTPDIPGNTSHYILVGLSIPDDYWKSHHDQLERIKSRFGLQEAEIHTAWMMRTYLEQSSIPDFQSMSWAQRRSQAVRARNAEILRLQRENRRRVKQTRKNYRNTDAYIHLTLDERRQAVTALAELISSWGWARLFAECIDKLHFDPALTSTTVHEQAFEQVVSRFEQYLQNTQSGYGLLVPRQQPNSGQPTHRIDEVIPAKRNVVDPDRACN